MKSNLYFLSNYNTYYNRTLKREATLQDYLDKYEQSPAAIANFNFTMRDSVNTEIIVNPLVDTDFHGRYLLVEQGEKLSRWFIIETYLIRENQYRLTLRRDLVADFLDPLLESTVYVEKGRLTQDTLSIDNINPLVFNQEGFTANQIKKNETLLKDKLGCKWIVGYLNKGYLRTATTPVTEADKEIDTADNTTKIDIIYETQEDFDNLISRYKTDSIAYATSIEATFVYQQKVSNMYSGVLYKVVVGKDSLSRTLIDSSRDTQVNGRNPGDSMDGFSLATNNYDKMLEYANTKYKDVYGRTENIQEWFDVLNLSNKTVLIRNTGKLYQCTVNKFATYPSRNSTVDPSTDPIWYDNLVSFVARFGGAPAQRDSSVFSMNITWSDSINIETKELETGVYNATIQKTHNRTNEEAFDAFAIPYIENKPIQLYVEGVQNVKDIFDYEAALAIAQEICDVTTEAIDLQLLPYCPLPSRYIGPPAKHILPDSPAEYLITIPEDESTKTVSLIYKGETVVNSIFWLTSTQFSNVIKYNDTNDYSSVDKIKAINQLDTWRISSGDYSSSFEFNMARNRGVRFFEIDCAYKPYQPYIHIQPNFGGLYGQDYNDTRGLVCSNTNYSLPRLTDAWETYERNNLNYMNAFNRQIENMDINRKHQRISEIGGLVGGALTGAASGAVMGSVIPGVGTAIGAGIGAAAGGIVSAGAGAIDMYVNEQLYKENKQYTIDQFNMSLENIRALPNTLAAVGALNPNNKVFPVLEFYSCEDIEREAFKQKLKWNGMTIGVLTDNISDYIDSQNITYFKGQLVYMPLTSVAIDSHEMSELANELAKGILIDKGVI